jgi:purine-nucleoside phosphorylase
MTGTGSFEHIDEAASYIRARCGTLPDTAVVLGSGLGDFADRLRNAVTTPYADVPHWPASRVVGHSGRLIIGDVGSRRIAALAGRAHFYEGHDLATVVFAVRAMGRLGVKQLILTNAAGGINTGFAQGALMVIDDHINLLGSNPLVGPNDERLGVRFPDMSEVYSSRLRRIADEAAAAAGVPVTHGVYVATHGPSYETPAEIRFFRSIGADAVGMSTVPEAIAARHMGIEVLGISCITNMAAGVLPGPLNPRRGHGNGPAVRGSFIALLEGILPGSDAKALIAAARRARRHAHARTRASRSAPRWKPPMAHVITGCNVENATYGLTICAERVAMFKAISEGHRRFKRVAVVADTADPTPPCGACRQILWEFGGDLEVVLANLRRETGRYALSELLPLPFDGRLLK